MEEKKPVTAQEFDELIKKIREEREKADALKSQLTEKNKEVMGLQAQAAMYLEELNRDNYTSPSGTVYRSQKWSWKLPSSDEDFAAFRGWLREKGIEDDYLTVNSQSFNSLMKAEKEAADKDGSIVSVPGVGQPTLFVDVRFLTK